MAITVYKSKCTGCGVCENVCPKEAIEVAEDTAEINKDICEACGKCVNACPNDAIRQQ